MNGIKQTGLTSAFVAATLIVANMVASQPSAELVVAALSHPYRPVEEAADDVRRPPLEVLMFAGIETSMSVLELEAGGGWYTEILAHTVGADGMVYMQNTPAFEGFTGDADNN
ncbi:MAG: hypothetical protein OXE78_05095 [Gammaproteobacteria bacterium]|nr:hypothetical protein [Gammaproteobacteria bacterium]MCY4358990.1 hypothetical protein [Gammaproteobacteria bacterium]